MAACKQHDLPYDEGFKLVWKSNKFKTSLTEMYDLSVDDNRTLFMQRSFLKSHKKDVKSIDLKSKYKKMLKVESKEKLISKAELVEFNSPQQILVAAQNGLNTCYEYYKYDMSKDDKVKYLEESVEVMLKLNLDLIRYIDLIDIIVEALKLFLEKIIDPAYGRTSVFNENGKFVRNEYDKKLNELYDNEVRNNFKSNTNVVLKEGGNCIHGAPCWYFNFGLACPHAPLCMNEGLMHIALSHFCLKCGKQDDINKGKEHALVECPQFRATWMPRAIGNDWSTRVYSRPIMAELIKKAAESKRARENRNRGNNRNGRGDGNGRNGRGNGKNGRSNGGNNNGTGNNNNGNPSQSQTPNGKTQNGAKDKKTTKKDNSS